MIPTIGIMIGVYIVIRMISFATRKGERKESLIVVILSLLNIIVTIILMIDLLFSGVGRGLPGLPR